MWIWDSVGAGGLGAQVSERTGALQRAGCRPCLQEASPPSWLPGLHLGFISSLRPAVLPTEGPWTRRRKVHGPVGPHVAWAGSPPHPGLDLLSAEWGQLPRRAVGSFRGLTRKQRAWAEVCRPLWLGAGGAHCWGRLQGPPESPLKGVWGQGLGAPSVAPTLPAPALCGETGGPG